MRPIFLESHTNSRLRLARLALVQSLFPGRWQQQLSPAKTSAKPDPILGVITVEEACPASIGNYKHGKVPVLVVQSTISGHQT